MRGLGGTIRVRSTEDPELEIDPCRCAVRSLWKCSAKSRPTPEAYSYLMPGQKSVQMNIFALHFKAVPLKQFRTCVPLSACMALACRQLARWGERAVATGLGTEEYHETTRDTHDFGRRIGQLPEQRETDGEVDYRPLLHRDGSVLSAITLEVGCVAADRWSSLKALKEIIQLGGQLPEQRETDGEADYRPLLHHDGSVLSAITLQVGLFATHH